MIALPRLLSAACAALAALMTVSSLQAAPRLLRLHPPDGQALDYAALSAIIEEEAGIRLVADATDEAGDDPLASLADGSADLAIIENTRLFREGVRTVLPLYSSVVHLAARADASSSRFRDMQREVVVDLVGGSHTGALITDLVFERAREISTTWRPLRGASAEVPDLIVYVGPIDPENTSWFRPGFELISLQRIDAAGAEFYSEGISYLVPQLEAQRIPALTYSLPGNEAGIEALAVDMLLVARRDLDAEIVYRLVEALVEQKARFAAVEPTLFRWLRSATLDGEFAFPLHRGARQYLERDEPGFLERYAETLNFLVYLVALMVTGLLGLNRWRARRRKDRIDTFYARVLELRRAAPFEDRQLVLKKLDAIEEEAFQLLIAERLAADESFRIFSELATGLRRELKDA